MDIETAVRLSSDPSYKQHSAVLAARLKERQDEEKSLAESVAEEAKTAPGDPRTEGECRRVLAILRK